MLIRNMLKHSSSFFHGTQLRVSPGLSKEGWQHGSAMMAWFSEARGGYMSILSTNKTGDGDGQKNDFCLYGSDHGNVTGSI